MKIPYGSSFSYIDPQCGVRTYENLYNKIFKRVLV